MTKLFDNIQFGDKFLTTENKQAIFLRFTENAEFKFAIFYVQDWGNVQVYAENGKEVHGDCAHSIVGKQNQPSLPSNLDEAAEDCTYCEHAYARESFKEGADWMAGQGVKATATVGYYNQSGLSILTEPSIKKLGFKEGDELEITIRKK